MLANRPACKLQLASLMASDIQLDIKALEEGYATASTRVLQFGKVLGIQIFLSVFGASLMELLCNLRRSFVCAI